ncbi:MAG: dUTP diphosphatase [Treponema sp.]|jgi:dUTP pyrophosphatase|nr:dUTP diphosphatase [Treponema sp.]
MNGEPVLKILRKDASIPLPQYESEGAAGFDLRAFVDVPFDIPPLGRAKIPTGLRIEIPAGYEAQVRPRSGLALRHGVTVLNSPGTIDSDYRGDLEIILINLGAETFTVCNGDRIAQLVVAPVCRANSVNAASLTETKRGEGGFGSTGI